MIEFFTEKSFPITIIFKDFETIKKELFKDDFTKTKIVEENIKEVKQLYISELYLDNAREFYGAIYIERKDCPNKTFIVGNAGAWGTLSNYISNQLKCELIHFDFNNFECVKRAGFTYTNYKEEKRRTVQANYDEKWHFLQKGELLSFENTSYYTKKKIINRMNNKILKEYFSYISNFNVDTMFNKDIAKSIYLKYLIGKNR